MPNGVAKCSLPEAALHQHEGSQFTGIFWSAIRRSHSMNKIEMTVEVELTIIHVKYAGLWQRVCWGRKLSLCAVLASYGVYGQSPERPFRIQQFHRYLCSRLNFVRLLMPCIGCTGSCRRFPLPCKVRMQPPLTPTKLLIPNPYDILSITLSIPHQTRDTLLLPLNLTSFQP